MGDLSAHFSRWEFADRRTGELVGPDPALIEVLEAIRRRVGRPVRILSGYRSRSTNAAVGGARRSTHLAGRAADIGQGLCTPQQARDAGAIGIGIRNGWVVHVDTRKGRTVSWHY